MSNTQILGTWAVPHYQVQLKDRHGSLSARIHNAQGRSRQIKSSHVYCGISGTTQQADVIQKIKNLSPDKISVFLYPPQHPSEVWIFEATKTAGIEINSAKILLKQDPPDPHKALLHFKKARKLQSKKGDITEIKQVIIEVKHHCLILKWTSISNHYLSDDETTLFRETLERYQNEDNILTCFRELLETKAHFSPHHHLMAALIHEERKEFLLAMEDYLSLSRKSSFAQACIEKAYALLKTASQKDKALQIRLDGVRIAFEKSLTKLRPYPNTPPTCFICFNVEEKEVGQWLEDTLVPDLDRLGIKPLFCFHDLSPGQELDTFQELARNADLVIIACTPGLAAKCEKRKKTPIGLAQEIRMIKGRYNDEDKANTIFPLFLKGNRKESLPTAYFEHIFGTKFSPFKNDSFEINYFSNAFDLLFAMRGIPRKEARKTLRRFLHTTKKILRGEVNKEEVAQWRASQKHRTQVLRKSIAERVSTHTQMVNLPLPPPDFTGRRQQLVVLHEACQQHHRVAITGLGGIGKSSLALKYADLYKSHYHFIHFMLASTPQLIVEGLLRLADDLDIPKSDKPKERLSWLKVTLGRIDKEYLLIFDGIDRKEAFDEATQYLPDRGRCLLLTTRMPKQARLNGFELVEIRPFSPEEAIDYLLKTTRSHDRKSAQQLAKKLGYLPLALTHAARFIINQCSIQSYIGLFDEFNLKLFENTQLDLKENERTILTTWQISIDVIKQKPNGSLATEMLDFFAFLGQASIPLSLVKGWGEIRHPDITYLELTKALKHLLDYSMIGSPQADHYAVHLLVQSVTSYQMPHKKQKSVFRQTVETLLSVLGSFNEDDPTTWSQTKSNMPHALSLVEAPLIACIDLEKQSRFFSKLGEVHILLGNPQKALGVYQKALEITKQLFGETHHDVTPSYSNIGMVHQSLGENAQALEFLHKALEIQLQVYGETHHDVASSYNNIGTVHLSCGESAQALEFLHKALKIQLQMYGETHPHIARSYNNIGMVYDSLGKNTQAIKFLQKALKILVQVYGENHPYVARSYNNIGMAYQSLGENDQALGFHQKALKILVQVYGENHPNVAQSYNNIGTTYQSLGENDQALGFHQKTLKIWLQVYGENHPHVAKSYSNVGMVYQSRGENAQALKFFQKALKIQLQVYGENHPDVATSYNNIAMVYQSLGENDQALGFHQKALKNLHQVYGENHPHVAKSYSNVGMVYQSRGENAQALKFFQKALKIQLQVYGENHPDVARSYNNIGTVHLSCGENVQALEFHHKALKIWLQVYGENHPDVSASYNNIAAVYQSLGENTQALKFFQKALKIQLQVYRENHPDVATSYNNIAMVYQSLGENDQALGFHQKALKIQLQVYEENHPAVATSYNNIGTVYQNFGENAQALEFHHKALKMQLQVYEENHPAVATSYNNIGTVYQNFGENAQALEFHHKALKMQLQAYGENHPDVARSYNNIGMVYQSLGKNAQALEFLKKALKIQFRLYGENHPDVALNYCNTGTVYQSLGKNGQALKFLKKALKIQFRLYGENHPDVALNYFNTGTVHLSRGENSLALEFFHKALKIDLQMYGENHPNVALNYYNTGIVYQSHRENAQALEFFHKALKIWRNFYPDSRPEIISSLNIIKNISG